jgi:hypothetical protein
MEYSVIKGLVFQQINCTKKKKEQGEGYGRKNVPDIVTKCHIWALFEKM